MQTSLPKPSTPWLMLVSRSLLFIFFQALIALVLAAAGQSPAWDASVGWWTVVAILTNFVSIYLLVRLFKAEGKRYLDILRFSRATYKKDLLWFFASGVIGLPLAAAPVNYLGAAIFGESMTPINMMFRPLPAWGMVFSILFPLTIAFAELPTYFGYVMPRLAVQVKNGWLAWGLCSLFLALQHVFLPFIFDGRFILWRAGMYLPFALFAGLLLKLRPGLLPYFVIVHALIDFLTLSTYFML
jgi:hypothetical protein